jgi:hypothetical protein
MLAKLNACANNKRVYLANEIFVEPCEYLMSTFKIHLRFFKCLFLENAGLSGIER